MRVRDIMTASVISVQPDTPVKSIAERLVRFGVAGMPVVNADGGLVGFVTEADLIARPAAGGPRRRFLELVGRLSGRGHNWAAKASGMTAAEVMTRNVVVCHLDDDVRLVARRMLQRGVKSLPVVAGEIVGMVSCRDILRMFDRTDREILADIETLRFPDGASVDIVVHDGVVTVSGNVSQPDDAVAVVAEVERVMGVIAVIDQLEADQARLLSASR